MRGDSVSANMDEVYAARDGRLARCGRGAVQLRAEML
jgi:hypothetical protein